MTHLNVRLRKTIMPVMLLLAVVFGLSACKKTDNQPSHTPAAGLMAVNLVPDRDAIIVAVGGNSLSNAPLYFSNYTGGYQGVYVGSRTLESYDFNTRELLATTTNSFTDSSYYSLFVTGTENNYKNILVKDPLDSLPTGTGQSFVRFINAVTDSVQNPTVQISAGGSAVFDAQPTFGFVSDFKAVMPGTLSVAVSGEAIDASRDITLVKDKIYTILLAGQPGATNAERGVSVKYIENGIVSE